MDKMKGDAWKVSETALIERINEQYRQYRMLYYFSQDAGMNTTITIHLEWERYIHRNQEIVKGWLQYSMIMYLQRRNPSVPGIADKLKPPAERKLEKVQKYWKLLISIEPVREIYHDELITVNDISIDHFVPWSYGAHDEFWNLHPTTKSINSSKSNNLPDCDTYFPKLCELEYKSYELMNRYDKVRAEFERCAKEHLNSMEIKGRVYRPGLDYDEFAGVLEEVVRPVYLSAKNCGFRSWVYE